MKLTRSATAGGAALAAYARCWAYMRKARARLGVLIAVVLAASVDAEQQERRTFELSFGAGAGVELDTRVVRVHEHHACIGHVAVARVSSMPAWDARGPLVPELAVELSASYSVTRRWSLPVDRVVAGVRGEEVLVPLGLVRPREEALWISASGGIRTGVVPYDAKLGLSVACPTSPDLRDLFGRSDYLRCFEFQDLDSGETRRLAFQGPCT